MYMRIRSAMKRARDKREFLFSGKGNEPVLTVTVSKHVVYVHRFFSGNEYSYFIAQCTLQRFVI